MNYEIEDIQGLMNDLSTIGLSRKSLVYKTHYGFGEDLKGVNDGVTPLYITREGADLMQETGFGKWIKLTFAIIWSNWEDLNGNLFGGSWTEFPLPAADLVGSDLLMVTLFQSSPRMTFPGELPSERVKMAYEILMVQILKVKFDEE
jgi:hypothetical protein